MGGNFAAVFVALYVGHVIGDHWIQTDEQACTKGLPGNIGRWACFKHVWTLTATKIIFLAAASVVLDMHLHMGAYAVAFAVDAASHYWTDRRTTLARLAYALPVRGFYDLGRPRPGHDDNPTLGTGAYALDQAFHIGWLFAAALIIGGMS